MTAILLTTLNARFSHTSLGLRYLLANMGELEGETGLREFTLNQRPIDIAEQLLAEGPTIIGLAVYVWNARESLELVGLLKAICPELTIVLGGPEVSHEHRQQPIVTLADYLICGPGEVAFAELCRQILAGKPPASRVITPPLPPLDQLRLPYRHYSDEDIAHRVLYVEASRGCPFRCRFCLSALDKTLLPFDLERFLDEMAELYRRGARRFKFVDRTFNIRIDHGIRILEFFLERLDESLFLHFELIPDHLPERLKAVIARFPPGSLQFEIGIQTLDPQVQALIDRRQDNDQSLENLRWLMAESHAHLHADLIIGLPGEDMAGFGRGLDRLVAMRPHEVQLGILKRLRGTPICEQQQRFDLRFASAPPYTLLSSDRIDFPTMQRLTRFARYWELVANSGRFRHTLPALFGARPFDRFLAFSDWLFATTGQTHKIHLPRLFDLVEQWFAGEGELSQVTPVLALDRQRALASHQSSTESAQRRQRRHQPDHHRPPQTPLDA